MIFFAEEICELGFEIVGCGGRVGRGVAGGQEFGVVLATVVCVLGFGVLFDGVFLVFGVFESGFELIDFFFFGKSFFDGELAGFSFGDFSCCAFGVFDVSTFGRR